MRLSSHLVGWIRTIQTFMVSSQCQGPYLQDVDIATGDSNTVLGLQNRVRGFNIESFIQQQDTHSGRPKRQALPSDTSHLHNPYAGVSYAWQLNETVDHFLGRLPPDLTAQDETTPWIFICNPYILRVEKRLSDGQFSKGNEDEAPEEEGSRPSIISEGGLERLQLVTQFIEDSKKLMKAHPAIEREINKERKRAVDDILSLAHAAKVRTGKVRNLIICITNYH